MYEIPRDWTELVALKMIKFFDKVFSRFLCWLKITKILGILKKEYRINFEKKKKPSEPSGSLQMSFLQNIKKYLSKKVFITQS